MANGPQRARLETALTGAAEQDVENSSREWNRCVQIMRTISQSLEMASPAVKEEIGGETGPAVDAAFTRSSQGMTLKAEELVRGASALQQAANVITEARQEQQALASQPLSQPGPYRPPVGPPSDEDIQAEAENRQAHARYNAAFADQERRAQEKADYMDRVFARTTAVMKDIHGIPDPEPPGGGHPGGGAGGGAGGGGGGGPAAPGGNPGPKFPTPGTPGQPVPGPGPGTGPGFVPGPGTGPGFVPGPGTDYVPGSGGGAPQGGTTVDFTPGSGAGSVPPSSGGSVSPSSGGVSGGVSGSAGVGVAGAAAGGIGGGALAAGIAAGGIRGGGTPVVASPGTAASSVRGIGSTGRSGVSGALGRSGAAAVGSPGTAASRGAAGRSGAGRAGAAGTAAGRGAGGGRGGTGSSRGGAGGAGGRGAGGRGSAAGGVAAGRTGRGKDDEKGRKRDLFDAGEDWVDDEDAAPGIID